MSLSLRPGLAWASPCHSACSHATRRRRRSSLISPMPTVSAASPCHPLTIAPQSIEMMSPSRSRLAGPGMPCTISSFTEVQIVAGYPL